MRYQRLRGKNVVVNFITPEEIRRMELRDENKRHPIKVIFGEGTDAMQLLKRDTGYTASVSTARLLLKSSQQAVRLRMSSPHLRLCRSNLHP